MLYIFCFIILLMTNIYNIIYLFCLDKFTAQPAHPLLLSSINFTFYHLIRCVWYRSCKVSKNIIYYHPRTQLNAIQKSFLTQKKKTNHNPQNVNTFFYHVIIQYLCQHILIMQYKRINLPF